MILSFDIGGSRIKAALATGDRLTPLGEVPTPTQDFAAFVAALAGFAQGRDLAGVAISIAGIVVPETGRIRVANIPCADGRVLADDLSAGLGLPVLILNDADCFALAEAKRGAGRGHGIVFGIILGTGVGGGLVIDGRVVQGAGGFAGEWGHGPILAAPYDFPCGCGLRGCIDAACGARGMERLHRLLGHGEAASPEILASWAAGEAGAAETVERWLALIAPALAMVVNVVGAGVVPAGGGLANIRALLTALDSAVRRLTLRGGDAALVVPAECGPDAGLIGAAEAGLAAFGQGRGKAS